MSDYSQLFNYTVRLQLHKIACENKAVSAPITFEEIVMVVINYGIEYDVESRGFRAWFRSVAFKSQMELDTLFM